MKIAVLGLGPSLNLFMPDDYDLSIGVNDIWKYHKADVIVCLDKQTIFAGERLVTINNSHPQAFYSQIVNWDSRPDFQKIDFLPGYPNNFCKLDSSAFHKSYCSPFVACQIAFKYYRATEIHLFGIDMTNHPHLNGDICRKIKHHFVNLKIALEKKGCLLIVHGEGILKDL